MTSNGDLVRRALERIAKSNDPKDLRRMADNARSAGHDDVREAALRRLYAVSPDARPGTLEHDVWQSIFALESALSEERGKTTLLARTRQKITRDGELDTVADLVTKPPSEGYRMLLDRGWPELTFEAVALRYPERFEQPVLEAAKRRLDASALDLTNSS
jgi:hypothetical protein